MKTLLIASHEEAVREIIKTFAESIGYNVFSPARAKFSEEEFSELLKKQPTKVLIDVNYGDRASYDAEPIIVTARLMRDREYDLDTSLLGMTGHIDLAEEVQREHRIKTVAKTDIANLFGFLR